MYSEEQARKLVIETGKWLVEKGLVSRTWGNVSARISSTEFVITPSGKSYERLKEEDLVKVKIKNLSYEGDIKPSSEKGIHASAYSMRKECNFVIHTHQRYACAVAAEEISMPFAPCAEYALPGTDKLRKNVVKCIKQNSNARSFLLAKHGTLLLGNTVEEARTLAELLETQCENQFKSRIPSMDPCRNDEFDPDSVRNKTHPYVDVIQDECINECCQAGIELRPYIDDFAQIVGPTVRVVNNKNNEIFAGLIGRNAVLVKGVGAVCVGSSRLDVEAIGQIVSKNCAASCYIRNAKPLSRADAMIQRYIYLSSYSKKKDE